ncbi:MAG: LytTR family transcriptional regulator DNA-binding domain-containing protein [Bacteroides sp.]|jgi:two-component system LytT family response regulator|nr:LytTR family transcriptional regulator DNA-binding domain-containing protein [Bacteroides sp.]
MKQWKALIVDDEPLARLELMRLLEDYEQISIIGQSGTVPEAQRQIESLSPDLIFLDIDLGPKSGFDLLSLVENNFQTIFVTAFDAYALRAFEVNALDYLLKPINPARLEESVARLGNPFVGKAPVFLKPFDKILVNVGRTTRFIGVGSIEFIEANGDYTNIYTQEGMMGTLHHTIRKWMERLPSAMFCQVHRSFIVNINGIERIQPKENGIKELITKNNKVKIPVSRKYSKCLSHWKI